MSAMLHYRDIDKGLIHLSPCYSGLFFYNYTVYTISPEPTMYQLMSYHPTLLSYANYYLIFFIVVKAHIF